MNNSLEASKSVLDSSVSLDGGDFFLACTEHRDGFERFIGGRHIFETSSAVLESSIPAHAQYHASRFEFSPGSSTLFEVFFLEFSELQRNSNISGGGVDPVDKFGANAAEYVAFEARFIV
jgi:hypothetical protein